MKQVTATAPEYWASYLINGDASGLEPSEKAQADAWIERQGMGMPVSCSEESFLSNWHDAMLELGSKGENVLEYVFLTND